MVSVLALATGSAASGATEVGTDCAADAEAPPHTLVPLEKQPSGRPLTAPTSGVVTSWRIDLASPLTSAPAQALKVMRAESGANTFEVVAETAPMPLMAASNVFPARISVQAGDRFGVSGGEAGSVMFCSNRPGESFGSVGNDVRAGSSATFTPGSEVQVPVVATVEPDRDGDGYGDETQDGCPQSAAYQGPCPTITLDTFPVVLKRSILVLVGASETSSVQVFGQVGWKPRHKGGALATKTPGKPGDHISTGVIVGLSGGTTLVKPGEVTPYNVKLPKAVIRHLSDISPKQVVKGTITARTTDLAGRVTEHTITIRLHGRKRD
jgi:hypothetical protein